MFETRMSFLFYSMIASGNLTLKKLGMNMLYFMLYQLKIVLLSFGYIGGLSNVVDGESLVYRSLTSN